MHSRVVRIVLGELGAATGEDLLDCIRTLLGTVGGLLTDLVDGFLEGFVGPVLLRSLFFEVSHGLGVCCDVRKERQSDLVMDFEKQFWQFPHRH